MDLYSQILFPRLLDWTMSGEPFDQYRRSVLAEAWGNVLEIGFGTGLNLPHYPNPVQRLIVVDVNPGMNALAQKRIRASAIPVESRVLNGESLPMGDQEFDCVVSTWTLCSIQRIDQALGEIYRVLKPGGQFFFIEHGLSTEPNIQTWQNRLTPLQRKIADGCHLNRNIQRIIEEKFENLSLTQFYAENLPKVLGYMYQGVATKQA